jgi:transcriptional regulator with XRE-family HTH domain
VHTMATKAHVDPKYVYQLEKGTSQPTLEIVFRLTDALDVDPREMVGKTRSKVRRNSHA